MNIFYINIRLHYNPDIILISMSPMSRTLIRILVSILWMHLLLYLLLHYKVAEQYNSIITDLFDGNTSFVLCIGTITITREILCSPKFSALVCFIGDILMQIIDFTTLLCSTTGRMAIDIIHNILE